MLPRKIENWSLTGLRQGLVKSGGRLVKHARSAVGGLGNRQAITPRNQGDQNLDLRGVCRNH
jgi:hypothetical protein